MGEANAQAKGKGKGKNKGKGKGKGNPNSVRDGPPESAPVRELAAGRHGADHWDDLRRAWAGCLSQPKKGKGGHQPHHHPNQQNHRREYHPPGGQQPESSPVQSNWNLRSGSGGGGSGSGDHAQAGQKRKGKGKATNGTAGDGGQRAAKRHKGNPGPSGQGAGAGGAAEPHPDFWHPDGSVIIEVGKTRFCLHQSTLQKNSTYFADAFQKRGGHQSSKRTQLPVYQVDETTAEDFASLLTIIEEPMKYGEEPPPMPVLAGVLRAARALSFDAQRKWAERMLGRNWTSTLDALTANPMPHAAEALAFARSYGLMGVRKRASYELLRVPTFGQTTTTIAVAEGAKIGGGADAAGDLSRVDLVRFLHAREQLGLVWAEVAGKAPTDFACPRSTQTQVQQSERGGSNGSGGGGGGCASVNVDRVHARWVELVHSSGLYVQRMVDPLMGLQDLVEISWKDEGFCKKCISARRNAWEELRRQLWDGLDAWLELNVELVD